MISLCVCKTFRTDNCGFADISMDCLDFGALKAVFELLQMHYPER